MTSAKRPSGVDETVQRFEVTLESLRKLRGRIDAQHLEPADWSFVGALVSQQIGRAEARQERMVAKIAAGAAAAPASSSEADPDSDATNEGPVPTSGSPVSDANATERQGPALSVDDSGGDDDKSADDSSARKESEERKGHGRNGAGAYRNAQHLFYALVGVLGAVCEACKLGKMTRYREKIIIRVLGQPLFRAEQHHHEQARCRQCGHIVRAESPSTIHEGLGTEYIRYDWSTCAMLMVMHYFGGAPFKRLESLHHGWGIPMADANQWNLADGADDLLFPLWRALEKYGIREATNFRIDDTGSVVLSLKKEIDAELAVLRALGKSTKDVRTGINATGVYWETPSGPVILFYTGRHHAGEIIDQLLRHRLLSSPKLVKCSDAASKNFDHAHADKVIDSTCNAHALLKFRDIRDKYPLEYAEAGRVYKQVFDNDDRAKDLGLGHVERMLYHRQHSKPLMLELKKMCEERIRSKLVEPNSPLWEPLTFVINQWDRLTRFCEVPNVPLDTNLVEQALIMPVRYLGGSFNYQTENGALVGDHAMSLIATARAHGVEPVAYLTECLRNHEDLAKRPEHYLPWVYRERCKDQDASSRAPPSRTKSEPTPARSA